MEIVKTKPNMYSVSPEKISRKYKGEKSIIIIIIIYEYFSFNFCAVIIVKKQLELAIRQLNIFIPANPNWEKGELNKTNKGFAQWLRKRVGCLNE